MTKEKNTGIITSLPVSENIKIASGLPASKKYIKRFAEPLHFGADGKFRILHLTDIHEVDPEMDDDEDKSVPPKKSENAIRNIEYCLDAAKPDLVVSAVTT